MTGSKSSSKRSRAYSLWWACLVLVALLVSACSGRTGGTPSAAQPLATPTPGAELSSQIEQPPAAAQKVQPPAEAAPQATPTPAVFSPSRANPNIPGDILEQIGYFGGAGPGMCDTFGPQGNPSEITMDTCPGDSVEQMGFMRININGLQPGTTTSLVISSPSGVDQAHELTADSFGAAAFDFIPELESETGGYHLLLGSGQESIEKYIQVTAPKGPRLYLLPDNQQLVLINFSPNESLRLFLYQFSYEKGLVMQGWQSFRVNSDGSLTIQYPPLEEPYFYAIGDKSGLVPFVEKGASELRQTWAGGDIACPGAPAPLGLGMDSQAVVTAPRVLAEVEAYPDVFSFPIPKGTRVQLEFFWGAPKCQDEMIWWVIRCPQLEGLSCESYSRIWLPEGSGETYYLQPVKP